MKWKPFSTLAAILFVALVGVSLAAGAIANMLNNSELVAII